MSRGLPRPVREGLIRLGACSGVRLESAPDGGGTIVLTGIEGTDEERVDFEPAEGDAYGRAVRQIQEALDRDRERERERERDRPGQPGTREEFAKQVNLTRRQAYGPIYEAARKRWGTRDD